MKQQHPFPAFSHSALHAPTARQVRSRHSLEQMPKAIPVSGSGHHASGGAGGTVSTRDLVSRLGLSKMKREKKTFSVSHQWPQSQTPVTPSASTCRTPSHRDKRCKFCAFARCFTVCFHGQFCNWWGRGSLWFLACSWKSRAARCFVSAAASRFPSSSSLFCVLSCLVLT